MALQSVTRKQVIELARTIPISKLANWYEYGLFIQSRPPMVAAVEKKQLHATDDELMEEIAAWEAASDEDWMNFEEMLMEAR